MTAAAAEYLAIELENRRSRTAENVLAVASRNRRRARPILEEITAELIGHSDLSLILVAIKWAGDAPDGKPRDLDMAARALLKDAGFWDTEESRRHLCGSCWGPGPLAALFCAVLDFDADALRALIAELREINHELAALARTEAA